MYLPTLLPSLPVWMSSLARHMYRQYDTVPRSTTDIFSRLSTPAVLVAIISPIYSYSITSKNSSQTLLGSVESLLYDDVLLLTISKNNTYLIDICTS